MVTNPAYLDMAHTSVWAAFPYRECPARKDWAKREISHASRFLDRAVEVLDKDLIGVVYRLSRLAHYHAHRGLYYSQFESEEAAFIDEEAPYEYWEKAELKAKTADETFLKQFPINPAPQQWNQHREQEKRLYHNWEFQMDFDPIADQEQSDPWASDGDSWKPEGWQLSPKSEYNND